MIEDKYRPWINPSYFDDWKKIMDSSYYGKEKTMDFRYTVTCEDSNTKFNLSRDTVLKWIKNWSSSKIEAIIISRESDDYEEYLDTKILWTIDKSEHSLISDKKTISADFSAEHRDKHLFMTDLIYRLRDAGYISVDMYDKYWEYNYHWPMDKYLVTIRAEEKVEPETDKRVCYIDQITGQKFYTSEQVAKSLAKQIEDDMSLPWGDSEGYSKYFKGGDMKINIHTGGIMSNDSLTTYKMLINKMYGPGLNPGIVCYRYPSGGQYYNDIRDVIKKVQINEKKKVVTIVWTDGQVTLAKCGENDIWDPEKGLLVCIAKHMFVSGTQMNKWLKEQIPESVEESYKPKHAAE